MMYRTFISSAAALAAPRTINWGFLSAGKISSDFVQAMKVTENATATAVAARSSSSARKFADKHNIGKVHESYQDLVNDPDVDVVYVGSVADTHYDLAKMCLEAEKPTLIEKPLALNFDETQELVNIAKEKNVFLLEGMWSRFFPAMKKAREIVDSGAIGDVCMVQADFGWNTKDCTPEDRMWNPLSGGMAYDIAMYCAMLGQVGFRHAEVDSVHALCTHKRQGMDQTIMANIVFNKVGAGKGGLQFYVTGEANTEERTVIQGSGGRITIAAPAHTPTEIKVSYDTGRGESKEEILSFPIPDDSWAQWHYPSSIGFKYQIEEVNECIRAGLKECPTFTHADSLQLAYLMDEILEQVDHQGFLEQKEARNEVSESFAAEAA